jgi:uncharacterized protein (DUF488 family)
MTDSFHLYTIGFTKRRAEDFFETLRRHGVKRILDVRLRNTSSLSGFTKRDDLGYFARQLLDAAYVHEPALAPIEEMLDAYQETKDWAQYARDFRALLRARGRPEWLAREALALPTALLCSEPAAETCHRSLVAEFLAEELGPLSIVHL